MNATIGKYWGKVLNIGVDPGMDDVQRMRLFAVNAFMLISFILTAAFVLTFVLLGSYTALQGFVFLPIIFLIFYLNAKKHFKIANALVTYGLMLTTLTLAFADRRTGTEYILIALGCCSVVVYESISAIVSSFLFAFGCYVAYIYMDSVLPFVPDATNPYLLIQSSIMFVSAVAIVAQSMAFRSLIGRYANALRTAHKEVKLVNEELRTTNEGLESANEALITLNTQLDWIVRQKNLELQSYLDAININLYSGITDLRGTIIQVNTPLINVSGYSREEILGKNFRILNSGYHDEAFYKSLYECIHSGNTWRSEIRNQAKDGSFFWIDQVILPVKNETGGLKYFLMLGLPITRRKQVEEERLRTTQMLEAIAYKTSHELRGPLARILGLTYLVSQGMIGQEEMNSVNHKLGVASKELDAAARDLTAYLNAHHHTVDFSSNTTNELNN